MSAEPPTLGGDHLPYLIEEGEETGDIELLLYVDDLDQGEPSFPAVAIGKFDNKTLVALPQEAWRRKVAKRSMQAGALTKATVVEVLAAMADTKQQVDPAAFLKCWIGYLKDDLVNNLLPFDTFESCAGTFGVSEGEFLVPAAESLIAVANEHFAFFSAEGEPRDGSRSGGVGLAKRVTAIEDTLAKLSSGMETLLAAKNPPQVDRPPALRTRAATAAKTKATAPRVTFPSLDQGVVQAALQAGVPAHSLAQMEKLVSQNAKAKKVQETKAIVIDPLSELEEDDPGMDAPGVSGSPSGDRMTDSLEKLTSIVAMLAEDRKKTKSASRLEQALDSAQGSGASDSLSLGSGKKTAAARRALRPPSPGRDSSMHRTPDVRRPSLPNSRTRSTAYRLECKGLGGIQVAHRQLQDRGFLRMVLCGHHRRHGGWKLRSGESQSVPGPTTTRPGCYRQGQLVFGSRVGVGADTTNDDSGDTSSSQHPRRRIAFQPTLGTSLGGSDPGPSTRSRGFCFQEEECRKGSCQVDQRCRGRSRRSRSSPTKGEGKGQSIRCGREKPGCMMGHVGPPQADQDAWTKLPGADAATIHVPGFLNSLPRLLLKTKSSLRSFLASIVQDPVDEMLTTSLPSSSTWPIPIRTLRCSGVRAVPEYRRPLSSGWFASSWWCSIGYTWAIAQLLQLHCGWELD